MDRFSKRWSIEVSKGIIWYPATLAIRNVEMERNSDKLNFLKYCIFFLVLYNNR